MSMTQEAGRIVASLKSSASSQVSEIHRALLLKAANQIESDQAKLAECEAELAKADAVIASVVVGCDPPGCSCTFPGADCCAYAQAKTYWAQSIAARQQQASADNDGET